MAPSVSRPRTSGKLDNPALWVWSALVLLTLWRLWAGWMLPVTQDEAYYFDWAHELAWGYFDHPPGVALLAAGTLLAPGSALAGRLGTLLAATLTLLVLIRLYRSCGLRGGDLPIALVAAGTTLPGLASGVLATPDTALGLGWALALHEGLAALRGARRRWMSAGIATGLGLLGKYTMVLIGPVFLWAILWADPRALRTPWPYLGGLLALLVFAPNLAWNAENDWLTLRFQLGHGFSLPTGSLVANPLPVPAADAQAMSTPPADQRSVAAGLGSLLSFLGTQAALWGLLALPALGALVRRRTSAEPEKASIGDPAAKALLVAGTAFPLAFFALVAIVSEVEPNWPGMYLFTAAPLVAVLVRGMRTWMLVAAAGNLLLASLYVVHGASGMLPLLDGQNRVLRETHGYRQLAQWLTALPGPVFADRYQMVAMTRFYAPSLQTAQWPGMSRPSEYLRGAIATLSTREEIERAGGFWLLSKRVVPPDIPGCRPRSRSSLYFCRNGGLTRIAEGGERPCDKPLHRWTLFAYEIARSRPPRAGARQTPSD